MSLGGAGRCVLTAIDARRVAIVSGRSAGRGPASATIIDLGTLPPIHPRVEVATAVDNGRIADVADLATAQVEVREVRRKQIHVDGQPVGQPFE